MGPGNVTCKVLIQVLLKKLAKVCVVLLNIGQFSNILKLFQLLLVVTHSSHAVCHDIKKANSFWLKKR